jgi:L-aminopeptidase/D-esterase-like protein
VGKLFGIQRAMKGGIGTASLKLGSVTVAALVAVNAIGDVLDESGQVLAGARSAEARMGPHDAGPAGRRRSDTCDRRQRHHHRRGRHRRPR